MFYLSKPNPEKKARLQFSARCVRSVCCCVVYWMTRGEECHHHRIPHTCTLLLSFLLGPPLARCRCSTDRATEVIFASILIHVCASAYVFEILGVMLEEKSGGRKHGRRHLSICVAHTCVCVCDVYHQRAAHKRGGTPSLEQIKDRGG